MPARRAFEPHAAANAGVDQPPALTVSSPPAGPAPEGPDRPPEVIPELGRRRPELGRRRRRPRARVGRAASESVGVAARRGRAETGSRGARAAVAAKEARSGRRWGQRRGREAGGGGVEWREGGAGWGRALAMARERLPRGAELQRELNTAKRAWRRAARFDVA